MAKASFLPRSEISEELANYIRSNGSDADVSGFVGNTLKSDGAFDSFTNPGAASLAGERIMESVVKAIPKDCADCPRLSVNITRECSALHMNESITAVASCECVSAALCPKSAPISWAPVSAVRPRSKLAVGLEEFLKSGASSTEDFEREYMTMPLQPKKVEASKPVKTDAPKTKTELVW